MNIFTPSRKQGLRQPGLKVPSIRTGIVALLVAFCLAGFAATGCTFPTPGASNGSGQNQPGVATTAPQEPGSDETASQSTPAPPPASGNEASGSSEQPSQPIEAQQSPSASENEEISVVEDGHYTSKDEVALYIHTYGHVPSNYISKTKAKKAGWVPEKGNLWEVLPGMSIGGGGFHVEEGDDTGLPYAKGRSWYECDINYEGGYRGPERLVFSSDGLIYYTGDHYDTFEQLY